MNISLENLCSFQTQGLPLETCKTVATNLRCVASPEYGAFEFVCLVQAGCSWRHSLLNCTMAHCVWALSDEVPVDQISQNSEPNARNWIFDMNETMSDDMFARLVISLWAIWYARRKAIHEAIFQTPSSINSFIESYLSDLQVSAKPLL